MASACKGVLLNIPYYYYYFYCYMFRMQDVMMNIMFVGFSKCSHHSALLQALDHTSAKGYIVADTKRMYNSQGNTYILSHSNLCVIAQLQ